jgi:hypothetical protein
VEIRKLVLTTEKGGEFTSLREKTTLPPHFPLIKEVQRYEFELKPARQRN